jgi:hypothetical protein
MPRIALDCPDYLIYVHLFWCLHGSTPELEDFKIDEMRHAACASMAGWWLFFQYAI